MSETDVIIGGCNCGGVRYEIADVPVAVVACHCRNCQRQSGAAYSVNLVVAAASVTIEGDLSRYEDKKTESGKPVLREFCHRCGSPIRSIATTNPAMVAMKAGTLDDTSNFAPSLHIWTCEMVNWVAVPEGLPRFPKGPRRA